MDRIVPLTDRLRDQGKRLVADFWLRHSPDRQCGGYWTDLARDGSWYGDGEKWLIVQARTIYSFCIAYEWFGEQVYLDEAAQGVAFFREHMHDPQHGGWYYCVSRDGSTVLDELEATLRARLWLLRAGVSMPGSQETRPPWPKPSIPRTW